MSSTKLSQAEDIRSRIHNEEAKKIFKEFEKRNHHDKKKKLMTSYVNRRFKFWKLFYKIVFAQK